MIAMPDMFQSAGTFGARYFAILDAEAKRLDRKLTRAECIAKLDEFAAVMGVLKKKKPKGAARARNPLYDALALATGTRDLSQLTRAHAKAIAVALADIQAVTPDLTVDEINRRATAYKRRWPDPRNLSAPALAKHWASFGGAPTRTGFAVMEEPKDDWRPAAKLVAEETDDFTIRESRLSALADGYQWFQFSTDFKRLIFEKMQAKAKA